jgi:hypothetical protein
LAVAQFTTRPAGKAVDASGPVVVLDDVELLVQAAPPSGRRESSRNRPLRKIGAVAVRLLEEPKRFAGKRFDLAVYDPEGDGTRLASLGVHEHWNNSADKKYSRSLGKDKGIGLYAGPK